MSRSVRQDYDRMRGLQSEGKVIIPILQKFGAITLISDAVMFDLVAATDSRYEQKARKTVVAPTAEDWAKYHLAKRALLTLNAYEGTIGAEEVEIPCPKPTTHYEFLETIEEWLDRCRALRAEAEQEAA